MMSGKQPRVKNLLADFETRISHNEGSASSGMYLTNNLRNLSGESTLLTNQRKRSVKKIARNKSTDSSATSLSYPPKLSPKKRKKEKTTTSEPSSSKTVEKSVVTPDVKPNTILIKPKPKSILKKTTIGVKSIDASDMVSLSTTSVTSRTASLTDHDGSTVEGMNEILEKLSISRRKRNGRRQALIGPLVIPESIDEEHEECVGLTVAWDDSDSTLMEDDDTSILSNGSIPSKVVKCSRNYKGGAFGHDDEVSEGSSQPSISRSSSRVRELPRDMAFDSDDDKISDEESDKVSAFLRKARRHQHSVKPAHCRFW